MGGGDDYWRPHSQSFSSSQSLSQSQSQSSSSQTSHKSVDLTELDRLRVLVKYEFETALTTDELIEALGACHNNTREAYHYLKNKHQTQHYVTTMYGLSGESVKRRQDDDDEVMIIENPSKRMREGTPPASAHVAIAAQAQGPVQRSLRLHSSQDVDMSPPASQSSQQQQQQQQQREQQPYQMTGSGTTAPPNTQQQLQSQQESEVDIVFSQRNVATPSDSQQSADEEQEGTVDMELTAARLKAQQLLTNAIEDRRQNRMTSDASWISRMWDLLHVSSNLEIAHQLDLTCDAMGAWLKEFEEYEVATHTRVGLELLFEIISMLPRSDNVDELSQYVRPATQLSQDESEITAIGDLLQSPGAHQTAHARSIAAKNAIARVTEECSSCLEKLAWFKNVQKENVEYQTGVHAQIQDLNTRLSKLVEQCATEVHAGDCAVDDARELKEMRSQQLRDFVIKRRNELRTSGESEASAEIDAYSDVFNSDDVDVVELLQSRAESGKKIRQCVRGMQKGKKEYTFYQSASNLFNKIRKCREWSLQNALTDFEGARFASDQRATAALLRFIPILTTALHQYYEFHSIRQARAKEEASEQEHALERHVEYFGDSAPINKEEIEKRIREFVGVISRSMQMMLQIAASQSRLWEGKKDVLPREVCSVLVFEYGKLWKQLSGPVRDVMQSFVTNMQVDGLSGDTPVSFQVEQQPPQPMMNDLAPLPMPPVLRESPQRVASTRNSLSPGSAGLSGVKSSAPSTQASPIRFENISMTQEVDAFLRHAEPTAMEVTAPVTSPPKPPALPQAAPVPTAHPAAAPVHEYPVGTVLYTKFDVGKNVAQFSRGRVDKLLEDGMYSVVYDDGDVFSVPHEFLFTEEQLTDRVWGVCVARVQMQRDLEMRERNRDKDAAMADANAEAPGEGNCAIM